jgi:hypothetical protein
MPFEVNAISGIQVARRRTENVVGVPKFNEHACIIHRAFVFQSHS